MTPRLPIDVVRALVAHATFRHDSASRGTRAVLAAWLDDEAVHVRRVGARSFASYLDGLADSLRRPSRSRRVRKGLVN